MKVTVMNEIIEIPEKTTYLELSKKYADRFKGPIVAALTGNTLKHLLEEVSEEESITFCDPSVREGMDVYIRTVSMVVLKAVRDVLGKDTRVSIENSIKKNFYCEINHGKTVVDDEITGNKFGFDVDGDCVLL